MRKHAHDGDCRELLMRMAQGLEGDLSPADRRALARHLQGCKRCGEFSGSLARTVRLCEKAGAPEMSARTRARARRNIAQLLSASSARTSSARRSSARTRDAEEAKKPRRR